MNGNSTQSPAGKIVGVGVGPGDPDLLTLKAARLIGAADLIAYPAPETGESFARRIAHPHFRKGVAEHAIRMNIGDGAFPKDDVYDRAAELLGKEAKAGKLIVVLCEGDPFFYGSFLYLFQRLAGTCALEVVPGVSSLNACAAASGHPLAARNDALTIVPAPLSEDELHRRLVDCEAAAIIKLGRHLGKVRRVLDRLQLTGRTHYIERASLPEERSLPLAAVTGEIAPYFSMLLVHRRGHAWEQTP